MIDSDDDLTIGDDRMSDAVADAVDDALSVLQEQWDESDLGEMPALYRLGLARTATVIASVFASGQRDALDAMGEPGSLDGVWDRFRHIAPKVVLYVLQEVIESVSLLYAGGLDLGSIADDMLDDRDGDDIRFSDLPDDLKEAVAGGLGVSVDEFESRYGDVPVTMRDQLGDVVSPDAASECLEQGVGVAAIGKDLDGHRIGLDRESIERAFWQKRSNETPDDVLAQLLDIGGD